MYNCPEDFRLFCKNQEVKCHNCLANNQSSNSLRYVPIKDNEDYSYRKHPAFLMQQEEYKQIKQERAKEKNNDPKVKNKKSIYNKANNLEKKANKNLGAKNTVGSGKVFGDGDGILKLDREYYIEHKARLNNKSTLGPSKSEWDKAKNQGIELFLTSSSTEGTIVTMSLKTLKEILNLIQLDNK